MFNITDSGLTDEQKDVMMRLLNFITDDSGEQIITLGADAGTGKTYTMRNIIQCARVNGCKVSAAAFTGRACTQLNSSGVDAQTLHSLMYRPEVDLDGNLIGWNKRSKDEIIGEIGDALILDEASFIPLDIYVDIMDLGVKIINCGDTMQLPSISNINGEAVEFNAMLDTSELYVTLTKNQRFDENSGIGRLASHLRKHDSLPTISSNDLKYVSKKRVMGQMFHRDNQYDVVVCGTNTTRNRLNSLIRNARGFYDDIPEVGERIICLRNNVIGKSGEKIYNGELFTVEGVIQVDQNISIFMIISEDGIKRHSVPVHNMKWVDEGYDASYLGRKDLQDFGWGYALTCHKCQGSTFKDVLVVDEDVSWFVSQQKWRYVAISRAASELTIAI